MNDKNKPVVAHLIHRYLFLTGSWIYQQLIHHSNFQPIVLTPIVENLDVFPFQPIHSFRPYFYGSQLWRVALRKLAEGVTGRVQRQYVACLRQENARLLHAHFGTEGYYRLGMKKTSNLPMVTTFYGWDMSLLPKKHRYWRRRYMRLFAEGEMFLLEGSHMAQRLIDLGCPSGKVRVHRLGVDLEKIDFIPRVLAPGEPVRVLMAASVQEKKGTRYAVEAFARACQRLPNLQLTLIGGARTREELAILADCQEIVRRENVSDKVRFLGYVPYPEYLSEMRRAHLFLAPSVTARNGDTEGGAPVASIEASAGGMPVLSTFHCDIPEVVLNGVSGLLVPERDVDALTKALLEIASSPEVWTAFGRAGREHIEREYNIKLQMRKQEELYSELMQG